LALAATEFERRYHISVDTPETDKGDPTRKKVKVIIEIIIYKMYLFLMLSSMLSHLYFLNVNIIIIVQINTKY
jgi:hypothetical protein